MSRVLERHNRCRNTSECAMPGLAHRSLTTPCTPPEKPDKHAKQANKNKPNRRLAQDSAPRDHGVLVVVVDGLSANL